MRTKDLNMMLVIDALITHKRLPLNSVDDGMSFYSVFGIRYIEEENRYTEGKEGFSYKTLNRYVNELTENGIFVEKNSYYSINSKYLEAGEAEEKNKKLLTIALESGELDTYYRLLKILKGNLWKDQDDMEIYESRIQDDLPILSVDPNILTTILSAIDQRRLIEFDYKNKTTSIVPVCILVNRDNSKQYLFGIRRKKLSVPYDLSLITNITVLKKHEIDTEPYLKQVKQQWDSDGQLLDIEILVRKKNDVGRYITNQLEKYFGFPNMENEEIILFRGTVHGINSFKAFVREHIDSCIITEPKYLFDELISSMEEKSHRYEEVS